MDPVSYNKQTLQKNLLSYFVKLPNVIKSLALGYLALYSDGISAAMMSKVEVSRITCPPKNLDFSGAASRQLVNTYCQCPEAAKLLNKTAALYQTIYMNVGDYPTSSAQTSGLALVNMEKLPPKKAAALLQRSIDEQTFSIFINQMEHLKEMTDQPRSRIESLLFELNNGLQKNSWNKRVIAAYRGDLSREEFALQTEKMEWITHRETLKTLAKCQPIWRNPYEVDDATFEEHLFSQEMHGHTDFMRAFWYDHHQKTYCKKHPEDSESCKGSKAELVDYHAYTQKPLEEQHQIILERIAKNFHKAPLKLQNEMLERYGDVLKQKISKRKSKDKEL